MPFRNDEQKESALVLVAQVVALLLVFAVPVVALLLIFREQTRTIILVSAYALFGISAMFAGVGWSEPAYGRDAKFYTRWIIVFTVIAMAASRWYATEDQEMIEWAGDVLIRSIILITPFYLGRFISSQLRKASKPRDGE